MKKSIAFLFALFCVLPSFAELKSRTDKWENHQCRLVWDTNLSGNRKPDDSNWAKNSWGHGWTSAISHVYFMGPDDYGVHSWYDIILFCDDATSHYRVIVTNYSEDGAKEKESDDDYYNYNFAYSAFIEASNFYKSMLKILASAS